jgi:hypothetical protein
MCSDEQPASEDEKKHPNSVEYTFARDAPHCSAYSASRCAGSPQAAVDISELFDLEQLVDERTRAICEECTGRH